MIKFYLSHGTHRAELTWRYQKHKITVNTITNRTTTRNMGQPFIYTYTQSCCPRATAEGHTSTLIEGYWCHLRPPFNHNLSGNRPKPNQRTPTAPRAPVVFVPRIKIQGKPQSHVADSYRNSTQRIKLPNTTPFLFSTKVIKHKALPQSLLLTRVW